MQVAGEKSHWAKVTSGVTDHLPNFVILNKFCNLPLNIKICKRDYSNFDESALIDELSSIDWNTIFESNSDASCMFDSFYDVTSQIVNKHILVKQPCSIPVKILKCFVR